MGSPRKQRKKFSKPSHPWQKERILEEKELLYSFGLRRKFEIWKMNSILKNFTRQAKNLVTSDSPQVQREKGQLLTKLSSLGFLGKDSKLEDVLSLTLKDVLERRLQTLVFRKSLANSLRQARQFIVHEHISIGDKTITAPSYLVPMGEEDSIQFSQGSVIKEANHPIRVKEKAAKKAKTAKKESGEDNADSGKQKQPGAKEIKQKDEKAENAKKVKK